MIDGEKEKAGCTAGLFLVGIFALMFVIESPLYGILASALIVFGIVALNYPSFVCRYLYAIIRRPLTLEYVNKFLQGKGIATNVSSDEDRLEFKLYDFTWQIVVSGTKTVIGIAFPIPPDKVTVKMWAIANEVNENFFSVKNIICYYPPEEGDGKSDSGRKDALYNMMFTCENSCYNESDFNDFYESSIYELMNAMEYYKEHWERMMAESKQNTTSSKIGFTANREDNADNANNTDNADNADKSESTDKGEAKHKIGFR